MVSDKKVTREPIQVDMVGDKVTRELIQVGASTTESRN